MTAQVEGLPRGAVRAGVAGTVLVHGAALVVLLMGLSRAPSAFLPTYAVELIAAPRSSTAAAEATAGPAPEVRPAAALAPKPAPARPAARTRDRTPARTATPTPLPGETPGTGSDIANVKLPGRPFPFPEYLRNLVTQIYRRWNRPRDNSPLTAEVGFLILRDGTVRDIRLVQGSRSYSFDQEAMGAVEAAASIKAFGPLPAGYGADYLQVSFTFQPRQ